MRKLIAVMLVIGTINVFSGCMMIHDAFDGQGHHGGASSEPDRSEEPRNTHRH